MINNIKSALDVVLNLEEFKDYELIKAFVSEDEEEKYYSFQMKRKGFDDIPGLTIFMVSVFEDGTIVTGNDMIEPFDGREIPLP